MSWLLAVPAVLWSANSASALSPNKAIAEYMHDRWETGQGFPGGPVNAIAQTPDGYLWLGTNRGLVRFDGVSFVLIEHSDWSRVPFGPVLGLATDAQGNLWIRLQGPNLLRYHDGIFQKVLLESKGEETNVITAMCLGEGGEVLLSGYANGVVRSSNRGFITLLARRALPRVIISMAETRDGKVWLGTNEQGLYDFDQGRVTLLSAELQNKKINALLATNSELWIGTDSGLLHWNGKELSRGGSEALEQAQITAITKDGDSNVWVATSKGLLRIDDAGVSAAESDQKRPAVSVTALFEDREGSLWVGTTRGIERLRDSAFTTYFASDGLASQSNGAIYVDEQRRTWFAPGDGGLYWLKDRRVQRVTAGGLNDDVVYSIDGREGELWIGRRRGLTRLRESGSSFTARTYTTADGLAQDSVYAVHQSRDGSVWAGTLSAGVSQLKDGRFTTYNRANGLASNTVSSIAEDADGTMWFGTPNGLSAWSKGRWRTYTTQDGLPPGNVNCLQPGSAGVLWIATDNGLALLRSGSIQTPGDAPDSLREEIFGIEEDKSGALWIATANHILRVDGDKLIRQTVEGSDVREFGEGDGLLSAQGVKRYRTVVADRLGRIWISTNRGLSVVSPTSVKFSSPPALVHVDGIAVDGRRIKLGEEIRVPAPHQRITLSYTGLSLAFPARVRYMYRLDGFDESWTEPTASREAVYTNLQPGQYRFRVMASNSDGVWNSSEASLPFQIEPTLWQTWWFRWCGVLLVGLAVLASFRLRVMALTRRMKLRFEERLAERTRIAQELHDTLLQGVISASMQLHVVNEQTPAQSTVKPAINRILGLMARVSEEGRNAVEGLRTRQSSLDLGRAFSEIQQEFGSHDGVDFQVTVEGHARPLHPVIRDEVYRIGHEALTNAFRHAQANKIEVELEYADDQLRTLVRDNGTGFDSKTLRFGRERHWGLSGMQERAKRIGGELKVFSRAAAGTEVELIVPGRIAFVPAAAQATSNWVSRFLATWKQVAGGSSSERDQ
ncbi:MAG TPA: two-component regulator propeller domain-containing protein [Candidatus Eremiobacteraceae bacterium]|nr:two-component regulator propeller domain-containing protein [Candidatus Eremiobacteraceae bacterium]